MGRNEDFFSENFLKNRSKNLKELENKLKIIDFENKAKYKNPWKEKYFDDSSEFRANSTQKLNHMIKEAKKNEPLIFFEELEKNQTQKPKRDLLGIDISRFNLKNENNFHEIGINKSFLSSKIIQKIDEGNFEIEKTIDLHNLKINDAYNFFVSEILDAYKHHQRLILIITGKGYGAGKIKNDQKIQKDHYENFLDKEIIRNNIIDWINSSSHIFSICLYVNFAAKKHGGDGAFYIYLR